MAKLRISGDSSGYVDLEAPNAASSSTLDLDQVPQKNAATTGFTGNVGVGISTPSTTSGGYDGGNLHVHNSGTGSSIRLTNNTTGTGTSSGMLISKWSDSNTYFTNFDNGANTIFTQSNSSGTLQTTIKLDGDGYVTMPSQPGFHVANSGTPATSNFGSGENSLLHFDYVVSNVGSGWNTSSKRYTAPVTGRYMIYAQVRFDSLTTYSRCWVSTNGGTGQWWNLGLHSISPSGTFNLWTHTITGAIPLAAGDYIELRGGSNNSVGYHEGEGSFGGYLVG